jgi:hypothetical protein
VCGVPVQDTHRTQRSSGGVSYNGTGMLHESCLRVAVPGDEKRSREWSNEGASGDDSRLGEVYLFVPGEPA